jgi:hypothetical protein
VTQIVQILLAHPTDRALQTAGCALLAKVGLEDTTLGSTGACVAAANACNRFEDPITRGWAVWALAKLTCGGERNATQMMESGVCEAGMAALDSPYKIVASEAAGLVVTMAGRSEVLQKRMVELGAMDKLLSMGEHAPLTDNIWVYVMHGGRVFADADHFPDQRFYQVGHWCLGCCV